ncbi:MAG: DoxX family protein [Bacteroidetes bacterium]|jgi:putative oxidoreductase|nr:DoxX family protein [Bacteroidota bacterium]
MDTLDQHHYTAATLLARIFLGLLFLHQGYDAVFRVKMRNIVSTYDDMFAEHGISPVLTRVGVLYTSITELICGFLLIPGLFIHEALYLLGINILVTAFAFGLNTPMWDTRHVWPRLVLIVFLLIAPLSWHGLSLDTILFNLK